MAASNFDVCLKLVLLNEGGYSDLGADPGGATNFGITRATLAAWRKRPVSKAEVRALSAAAAAQVYRALFWGAVHGDDLPAGVDLAVFDWTVNAGPRRAILGLQRAVGADPDGVIGHLTIMAANASDPRVVVRQLCAARLSLLERLRTWRSFGRGWKARVARTEGAALAMVHTLSGGAHGR
jgi:lysozyme family protein